MMTKEEVLNLISERAICVKITDKIKSRKILEYLYPNAPINSRFYTYKYFLQHLNPESYTLTDYVDPSKYVNDIILYDLLFPIEVNNKLDFDINFLEF